MNRPKSSTARKTLIVGSVAAALAVAGFGAAFAQRADGRGAGPGGPMGPGMMMPGGMGMMGHGVMAERFCAAKDPFAPRITNGIEKLLQPTDAQKADFDALKTAVAKAETDLKAACPTEAELADRTPPGRLNLAEKHLSAMLAAVGTIKGPFNALYAKLDDAQRDRIRWAEGRAMSMHDRGMRGERGDHHGGPGWRWR